MSGLISKQDTLDKLNMMRIKKMEEKADVGLIWECLDLVKSMPTIKQKDRCVAKTNINLSDKGTLVWDIEVERIKGKWIEDAVTYYEAVNEKGGGVDENTPYFVDDIACSDCLAMFSTIDNQTERFNFCPNCGVDMRGEEDDERRSD